MVSTGNTWIDSVPSTRWPTPDNVPISNRKRKDTMAIAIVARTVSAYRVPRFNRNPLSPPPAITHINAAMSSSHIGPMTSSPANTPPPFVFGDSPKSRYCSGSAYRTAATPRQTLPSVRTEREAMRR